MGAHHASPSRSAGRLADRGILVASTALALTGAGTGAAFATAGQEQDDDRGGLGGVDVSTSEDSPVTSDPATTDPATSGSSESGSGDPSGLCDVAADMPDVGSLVPGLDLSAGPCSAQGSSEGVSGQSSEQRGEQEPVSSSEQGGGSGGDTRPAPSSATRPAQPQEPAPVRQQEPAPVRQQEPGNPADVPPPPGQTKTIDLPDRPGG